MNNGSYFFWQAVSASAKDSLETIEQLSALHDKNIALLPKTNRKIDNLRILFDYIEKYPIIDIKHTSEQLNVSYNTVSSAVRKLQDLGILKETTNSARNKVFAYSDYLDILKKDTL